MNAPTFGPPCTVAAEWKLPIWAIFTVIATNISPSTIEPHCSNVCITS